ncbi:hypothetical protein BSK52_03460 [Paenibacillus odorifer]|uniref:Uncharacterized protein n=1 Tax=Paenibacillus odorifer TaxID=189426 RepID=A0A1R0Y805_9BACL|nr:hypothetical protein BSK52_03460 [Paenibacillus odorifer]
MQYQTYRQYFKKDKFIQNLKESDNPDDQLYALTYSSLSWSTHIRRATYSNRVAEECQNLIELMLKRRDTSPGSSIAYLVSTESEKK